MEYLQKIDLDSHATANGLALQKLLQRDGLAAPYSVACIRTPPGRGSPAGLHSHPYEQVFYLVSGRMNIEIEGQTYVAEPGTVIVFPAGVKHRNWNTGTEPTVHLAFQIGAA